MKLKTVSVRLFDYDLDNLNEIKKYMSEIYNYLDPEINHRISTTAAIQFALRKTMQSIQQKDN